MYQQKTETSSFERSTIFQTCMFDHVKSVCTCVCACVQHMSHNYTITLNFLPSAILSEPAYQNSCQLLHLKWCHLYIHPIIKDLLKVYSPWKSSRK